MCFFLVAPIDTVFPLCRPRGSQLPVNVRTIPNRSRSLSPIQVRSDVPGVALLALGSLAVVLWKVRGATAEPTITSGSATAAQSAPAAASPSMAPATALAAEPSSAAATEPNPSNAAAAAAEPSTPAQVIVKPPKSDVQRPKAISRNKGQRALSSPATPAATAPPQPSPAAAPTPAPAHANCDPPFYFDAAGNRVFKQECL